MKQFKKIRRWVLGAVLAFSFNACNFLEQPVVTLVPDEFAITNGNQAKVAARGLFHRLQDQSLYGERLITVTGTLADELLWVGTDPGNRELELNEVQATNISIGGVYSKIYETVHQANSIIERVAALPDDDAVIADVVRKDVIAQALFVRALLFFHAALIWGDACMPLNSNFESNLVIARTPNHQVLLQVVKDLKDAEKVLKAGNGGEIGSDEDRCVPTSTACKALLSRVLLHTKQYEEAEAYATEVIAAYASLDLYRFSALWTEENKTSTVAAESILELYFDISDNNSLAFWFETATNGGRLEYVVGPEIARVMKNKGGVARLPASVRGGTTTYVNKYRDVQNGTDRVKIIRLAEVYLNRAEARARLGNEIGAKNDLLTVRRRAGASTLVNVNDDLLTLIYEERALELAFEGHRWYDLKRSGQILDVMGNENPDTWASNDTLMPIPAREFFLNRNITQNPGY